MNGLAFLWPWALALLLLTPLLVLAYRRLVRGGSRSHIVYPDAGLALLAARRARPWRHLPAIVYAAAVVVALLALARPTVPLLLPDDLSGVMITIETSRSMQAWDIAPTRLAATQEAAKELLESIPPSIKVGLATFSGYGTINVPLTLDLERLVASIDSLGTGGDFAFSFGILASLEALPEERPEGFAPGAIVLFSHGHDNSGNNPLAIAEEAAKRGIPIHTIGVGTHGSNFSEDILKLISDRTGGQYYPIFSAGDLTDAHRDLARVIALRPKITEVTAVVSLLAALLLALSLGLAHVRPQVLR